MSLKQTYQRYISSLLLLVMLWKITGWVGMGMMSSHFMDHSKEHCEVSFCFCEIEDGEKICRCHHSELHALNVKSNHNEDVNFSLGSTDIKHCYYSKSHDSPVQSDKVIVISDFRSLIPHSKDINRFYFVSAYSDGISQSLEKGFDPGLLRPPSA